VTQPAGAVSGLVLSSQPVIQVRDASNNLVTTSTAAVTVAIASGTGALLGTRTVNAVRGVVTFTDLRIDGVGAHTLTFTATGFNAATSSGFIMNCFHYEPSNHGRIAVVAMRRRVRSRPRHSNPRQCGPSRRRLDARRHRVGRVQRIALWRDDGERRQWRRDVHRPSRRRPGAVV
jgi:hypothetical protein